MDAKSLYHKWMKQWGSCIGQHEEEIVADLEAWAADQMKNIPANIEFARNEALEEAGKAAALVLFVAIIIWGAWRIWVKPVQVNPERQIWYVKR